MATHRGSNEVRRVANDAKSAASQAKQTEVVDKVVRIGYLARGIVYGLIGYLAFMTIVNGTGKITDQRGVLATIADKPWGKFVLVIVAIGLVGLFIWGLIRAFADPMHKGNDTKGLVTRAGYLISGLSYGALFLPTFNLIRGTGGQVPNTGQSAQNTAANIMTKPWGPTLIAIVGLVILGVGLYRIYEGYKAKFHERFKSYQMTNEQRRWAVRMGRFGYVALGLVLAIIGFLAFRAATTLNPRQIQGFDGALRYLLQQPYGPILVGIVALGLIAYAIYSFMGSLWFRIKEL